MTASLIGRISIEQYLESGQFVQIIAEGENDDGVCQCNFDWIKSLRQQCEKHNITFCFIETGTNFVKDGRSFRIPKKILQSEMAFKSNINFRGKAIEFQLKDQRGLPIDENKLYQPQYKKQCDKCGAKLICNGCSKCGRCD